MRYPTLKVFVPNCGWKLFFDSIRVMTDINSLETRQTVGIHVL